jgi:hypothetical protein
LPPPRYALYLVGGLVVAGLAASTAIRGHAPNGIAEWLAPVGPSVTIAAVLLWSFSRWLWRLRLLRDLHGIPVLHGTWHGELASEWIDPNTGQGIPPDPDVFLVIRQDFWRLSARLLTRESRSQSFAISLQHDGDGVYDLVYLYSNTPKAAARHRSEMHYGAVVLSAPVDPTAGLEGHYFTDRNTRGSLRFTAHFDTLVETHQHGIALVARSK